MKKDLLLIIIVAAMLLSLITFSTPKEIFPGNEAYYHLLVSEKNINQSPTITERPLFLSPYDYLLKAAFTIFNPIWFMKIFPIILGAICAILLYLIIRTRTNEKSALYSAIIFSLSPTFLYIFSTNSARIIPLFLILLGVYLLACKNKNAHYFSIIPFAIAAINSLFVAILAIIIYATYFMITKEKKYFLISSTAIIILETIYFDPKFILNYSLTNNSIITNLLSDFGGMLGISIFAAIFFIGGFIATKKRRYSYPIFIVMIIAFLIDYRTISYSNVFVCIFAGIGLNRSIEKKWTLKNLKQTMNFMMICGLLFSTVSHITVLKESGPSQDIIDASKWLRNNSNQDAVVLSSISNGFVIEYFSGLKVMIDPLTSNTKEFGILVNDSDEIFYSRTLEKTEKLLNDYKIKYIFIDSKMTDGQIWKRTNEGLLFLLTNQEKFPAAYKNGEVTIIEYTK